MGKLIKQKDNSIGSGKMDKYDTIYFIIWILTVIFGITVISYKELFSAIPLWFGIGISPAIITVYTIYLKMRKKGNIAVMFGILGNIFIFVAAFFIGAFLVVLIGR